MRLAGPSAPMTIRASMDSPFASIRQPPSCREIPVTRADVRKPAAASCRAAMPPEGPAPTTTASNTSRKESEADISTLRRGLGRESPREVFPVGGRPIHVRRDTAAKGRSALFRDQLDRGQDPEAVHGRVFGEAHLLHDLSRARVGVVPQEVEDRDLLSVEDLRDRAFLRARLELHPLVQPLPLLRR